MPIYRLIFLVVVLFIQSNAKATHALGGEITWECQGNGQYVFELIFYRDCNGFEVNTNSESLRVWGHPTINSIAVPFVERIDISPSCNPIGGGFQLECGTGAQGGNGPGAVEKVVYRSAPITIDGIPPQEGWVFTYENFSRNGNLTNISDPLTYGMTIRAKMFAVPGATPGECMDSSPRFLQDPYFVSCSGSNYLYNPHAVDKDLDSLSFRFSEPLNDFPTETYDPPNAPINLPFENGFSFNNPTPDNTFNNSNVPSVLNSVNGQLTFTSFTQGNFAVKIAVDAFRGGVKIATVEREMQLIVVSCNSGNNPPNITPPFAGGTFETEVFAGESIDFSLLISDNDLLDNGSAQTISLTATGVAFGIPIISSSNCDTEPCASLNANTPISNPTNLQVDFSWQTSCDHLLDATGNALDVVPYTFVFRVQDDYCPVPGVRYQTITIHVKNRDVIPPTFISCIATNESNDVEVQWEQSGNINNAFEGYTLDLIGEGEIGNYPAINSTTHIENSIGDQNNSFAIGVISGCEGNTTRFSDTIRSILLTLNNPGNGEAQLQWNRPRPTPASHYANEYQIWKEYPVGNWEQIATVPYTQTNFRDTITVCESFISYRVILPTSICPFTSNIEGDVFEDNIVPDIPIIYRASVDTVSQNVVIEWDVNRQEDTYGYVVYTMDNNNNLVELDTVWGRFNTTYEHDVNTALSPLEYSVAAFDSCFTDITPVTHQTSAKAEIHTTNFLSGTVNVCSRELELEWTGYDGMIQPSDYIVWGRKNEESWAIIAETNDLFWNIPIEFGDEYDIVIQVIDSATLKYAFSNRVLLSFAQAGGPTYSFLSTATVEENNVEVVHRVSLDGGVDRVELERFNPSVNDFEKIDEQIVTNDEELVFIDSEAEVNRRSYLYKTVVIDTCDQVLGESNLGQTIFLKTITDETAMTHVLQWTPYQEFIGNVVEYRIYKGYDGFFDSSPLVILPPNRFTYTDSLILEIDKHQGKVCYFIEAIEGDNFLGMPEKSKSNIACPVLPPLVFIPNAFSVGGKNPIFKPETSMHSFENYSFAIIDRYGRIIFESNDPDLGWNGRIKGSNEVAREGVYIYRLSLRDGNGIEVLKHGHVTLLDYR